MHVQVYTIRLSEIRVLIARSANEKGHPSGWPCAYNRLKSADYRSYAPNANSATAAPRNVPDKALLA